MKIYNKLNLNNKTLRMGLDQYGTVFIRVNNPNDSDSIFDVVLGDVETVKNLIFFLERYVEEINTYTGPLH